MSMRIRPRNHKTARGFVIGELLIALVLLAVAVSSLAALMYSVSRRPTSERDPQCVASAAAAGKCVPAVPEGGGPSKLLRSGCATRSVFDQRECKDTPASSVSGDSSAETLLKPRTDSASMAMLAKKQKAQRAPRPDRGFIR
jgi:Tfp pilus assembly protein PilV